MSDATLPPELWRALYERIDVDFGYRQLATHIGMDHTTLRRLLKGGPTSAASIQKVADAFRVTSAKIHELRGEAAPTYEPFILPDEAGRLNEKERRAIRSVIRVLIDAKDDDDDSSSDDMEGWSGGAAGGGIGPEGDWPEDGDKRNDIL